MMPSKAIKFWLPAFALMAMVTWLGCEQKGDISPTGSDLSVLMFIDRVGVSPNPIGPGDTATVEARIVTETTEPALGEDVRFSVSRGRLGLGSGEATVSTNDSGFARTTFIAPADTGSVLLRVELLSMSEMQTTTVYVSSAPANGGLLSVWSDAESLFAENGN
jgi:hypothetical protein